MDRIDHNILDILQRDASIRNVELAERVGLAPSSCLRRVRQLWDKGIITGSIILTDDEKMGRNIKALVSVHLANHNQDIFQNWMTSLAQEDAVTQAYSVSGESDAVIFLSLANMKEFQELSQRIFTGNPNVTQFFTQFILEEHRFKSQ